MTDEETVQSVVASNFQRSYTVRAEKEREFAALPSEIRSTLSAIADKVGFSALPEAKKGG